MLSILKPGPHKIKEVLVHASMSRYTYNEVGSTACEETVPNGYAENRYEKFLGMGNEVFTIGKRAVSKCEMYNLKLTELYLLDENAEPEQGAVMAVVTRHFGLWSINPVKVVYKGELQQKGDTIFSLAVGTLAGHEEKGEERFTIRLTKENKVFYQLFSFTKPAGILLMLAYPMERIVLHSFASNSADAIARLCKKELNHT
jgi:uncharacterized protein (UPF0548 family)